MNSRLNSSVPPSVNPSADLLPEYVAVVDNGSISKAARVLNVPRASLSRRMNALERALGVRLLHRQSRPMQLTPAGQELYRRAQRIMRDADDAWDAVRVHDATPRGLLRVSIPPQSPIFVDFIVQFAGAYPEVDLVVSTDARHVDLVAEGVDVAIRIGPIVDPNLFARRIWQSTTRAVAAPSYLAHAGTPRSLSDLAHHACMRSFDGTWSPSSRWPLQNGERVQVDGGLVCNDIGLLLRGAKAGLGIAILPTGIIQDALDAGELITVLPEVIGRSTEGHVVFVERTFMLPQVRAFVDDLLHYLDGLLLEQ